MDKVGLHNRVPGLTDIATEELSTLQPTLINRRCLRQLKGVLGLLFGAYYKTGSLIFLEAKSPSGRTNLDGSLIFFVENPHRVSN